MAGFSVRRGKPALARPSYGEPHGAVKYALLVGSWWAREEGTGGEARQPFPMSGYAGSLGGRLPSFWIGEGAVQTLEDLDRKAELCSTSGLPDLKAIRIPLLLGDSGGEEKIWSWSESGTTKTGEC